MRKRSASLGIINPDISRAQSICRETSKVAGQSWGRMPQPAIRLLILTGCRLREILHLEWQHVDLERGLLLLSDSKTGAKTVVWPPQPSKCLAGIPAHPGVPVCHRRGSLDRPRSDLKRPWELVTRAAGLTGVRIHDLRHTYASHGAAAGMGLTIVGRLLGHADVKTTNRYSHFDADPMRRAANAVAIPWQRRSVRR